MPAAGQFQYERGECGVNGIGRLVLASSGATLATELGAVPVLLLGGRAVQLRPVLQGLAQVDVRIFPDVMDAGKGKSGSVTTESLKGNSPDGVRFHSKKEVAGTRQRWVRTALPKIGFCWQRIGWIVDRGRGTWDAWLNPATGIGNTRGRFFVQTDMSGDASRRALTDPALVTECTNAA